MMAHFDSNYHGHHLNMFVNDSLHSHKIDGVMVVHYDADNWSVVHENQIYIHAFL